ncbi:MAG: flagellar type III secretion system pore protein FliP [Candidatus Geothermincolales bacterium]
MREKKAWLAKGKTTRAVAAAMAVLVAAGLIFLFLDRGPAVAQPQEEDLVRTLEEGAKSNSLVQLLIVITLLALIPTVLICMTCFTRVVVILSFMRNAIGTAQLPPNQVIIGVALFLSLFIMSPVVQRVNQEAVKPYMEGSIQREEAFRRGLEPLREFMLRQTDEKDLALFVDLSSEEKPESPEQVPTLVLVPAFVVSELKKAFIIAFLIFIPFLIIDILVAGTLMSMGMLMLPPMIISLPFKLLLFVMVDGWSLVVKSLVASFR